MNDMDIHLLTFNYLHALISYGKCRFGEKETIILMIRS